MKRESRAQKIKEIFIATAYEIISTEGAEAVSARSASEKAGYTVRTLYKHFRNMDELLWLARNEVINEFVSCLSSVKTDTNPVEQLKQNFLRYLNFFLENPNLYRFLYFYKLDPAYKTETPYHEKSDFSEELKDAFGKLIDEGYLNESDIATVPSILILSVQGLLTNLISGNDQLTDEEARQQLENIINYITER